MSDRLRALPLEPPPVSVRREKPVQGLPSDPGAKAWLALAQAAEALAAMARAAGGGKPNVFNGFDSLSLSPRPAVTVKELVAEFLAAKDLAGRSSTYLCLLSKHTRYFSRRRLSRLVTAVSAADVQSFLYQRPRWSAYTRRDAWGILRTLFNFARRRGYLERSPVEGVDRPVVPPAAPGIHTPVEVAKVLETARKMDPRLCRALAIRYFAGLRTKEANSLEEAQIGAKYIEVTAAKCKTRRRRLVAVQPNLAAWLELGGSLPLGDVNTRLWRLVKAAGVVWPSNVTRHSFCSYHLAEFSSAAKTALEAGHSEAMLFSHYREVVSAEAAHAYWNIFPA